MIKSNSFICAGCMDYLFKFPDKYFDIAVCDLCRNNPQYFKTI